MWSSSGGEDYNNNKGFNRVSSSSPSSSSSSSTTSSSPSPFSRTKTMEEVWKDINLSSLHDDHDNNPVVDPHTTNFQGVIFQDFLTTRPLNKDPPTCSAICARYGSPVPPPATMLTLHSGHELRLFGNSNPAVRLNGSLLQHQPNAPFNGKKRFPESDNDSGDRRRKRMIKNRESAARSRARKQAYTNELELEVAHLMEENARLKKQQQQLCLAAAAQIPKKNKLHRTSTAPF